MVTDITARKQAERALQLNLEFQRNLLNELDHRVRNNLSSLASLIDLSRGSTDSVDEFAQMIGGRVQAMAKAHALTGQTAGAVMDLRRVLEEMVPPALRNRTTFEGPGVKVADRRVIIPLALLMHELLSRSQRCGALSGSEGRVFVRWESPLDAENPTIDIVWQESPANEPLAPCEDGALPDEIIRGLVRSDLRGTIEPTPGGCRMRLPWQEPAANGTPHQPEPLQT
jgi:two-component sensor histidine kinase